jgi:hypothetical protein
MTIRRYAYFAATYVALAGSGWYFVGSMSQGVADGTGVAPFWLELLDELVYWLMAPLGTAALSVFPAVGTFTLVGAFGLLAACFANAILLACLVAVCMRGVRRLAAE